MKFLNKPPPSVHGKRAEMGGPLGRPQVESAPIER